jgi:hypothetical protein
MPYDDRSSQHRSQLLNVRLRECERRCKSWSTVFHQTCRQSHQNESHHVTCAKDWITSQKLLCKYIILYNQVNYEFDSIIFRWTPMPNRCRFCSIELERRSLRDSHQRVCLHGTHFYLTLAHNVRVEFIRDDEGKFTCQCSQKSCRKTYKSTQKLQNHLKDFSEYDWLGPHFDGVEVDCRYKTVF